MTFPTASLSPSSNCILAVYILKNHCTKDMCCWEKKKQNPNHLCVVIPKSEDTERQNMLIKTQRGENLIRSLFV